MTIYLVPCGVSILDNIREGRGAPSVDFFDPGAALGGLLAHASTLRAQPAAWPTIYAMKPELLSLRSWTTEVSAELSTLAARGANWRHATIVILASDSNEGMLSALLNATYLAEQRDAGADQVEYAVAAAGMRFRSRSGVIVVCTIPGLKPHPGDGFRQAAEGVAYVMNAIYHNVLVSKDIVEVHLSGGYKATLLHTLSLAEVLRSRLLTKHVAVSAWYLADEKSPNGAVQAEQIGLRGFPEWHIIAMRDELSAVAKGDFPAEPAHNGALWDNSGLNPYGSAVLTLLHDDPQDLPGEEP